MGSIQYGASGPAVDAELETAIVSSTGKTRLRAALERAQKGGAPCVGQWLEFPGYSLARTVAGLGSDVSLHIYLLPAKDINLQRKMTNTP